MLQFRPRFTLKLLDIQIYFASGFAPSSGLSTSPILSSDPNLIQIWPIFDHDLFIQILGSIFLLISNIKIRFRVCPLQSFEYCLFKVLSIVGDFEKLGFHPELALIGFWMIKLYPLQTVARYLKTKFGSNNWEIHY